MRLCGGDFELDNDERPAEVDADVQWVARTVVELAYKATSGLGFDHRHDLCAQPVANERVEGKVLPASDPEMSFDISRCV